MCKKIKRNNHTVSSIWIITSLFVIGGHTIGTSHCPSFTNRLYNFTGKGDTDPSLDPNYIAKLKSKCKPGDQTTLAEMDPGSYKTFDEGYYTHLLPKEGDFFNQTLPYLLMVKPGLMLNFKLMDPLSSRILVYPWLKWVGSEFLRVPLVKLGKCALRLIN